MDLTGQVFCEFLRTTQLLEQELRLRKSILVPMRIMPNVPVNLGTITDAATTASLPVISAQVITVIVVRCAIVIIATTIIK